MLKSTHCTLKNTTLKTIVITYLLTVICTDPNLNLICEYVIVTNELSKRAEFISALAIVLLTLTAGAHMLLVNPENSSEKKANDSAATNQ